MLLLLWSCIASSADIPPEDLIAQGIDERVHGNLYRSAEILGAAAKVAKAAESGSALQRAHGELGITLMAAHQYAASELKLQEAYASATTTDRATWATHLGNLALIRKQSSVAQTYYQEALTLASDQPQVRLSVQLALVRTLPIARQLEALRKISAELVSAPATNPFARFHVNLASQSRHLGRAGLRLAYEHLEMAQRAAHAEGNRRVEVEALDLLAQMYEDTHRTPEAAQINQQGLNVAHAADASLVPDLLIHLLWRQARLSQASGNNALALVSYQAAVEHIESVRQDIPVEYEDGTSSFRETLEPIYMGWVDLILRQIGNPGDPAQQAQLRKVRDTIEITRQTELQDFLGDRCSVEIVQGGAGARVLPGVAVLYPLVFKDRVELLLETTDGIVLRSVPVTGAALSQVAKGFANLSRNEMDGALESSRQLYDWLIRPLQQDLAAANVKNLVVAAEGPLRLIPMGALNNGTQYLIEKYAVTVVTGMSMTNTAPASGRKILALVAGVAEPGPVVEKMGELLAAGALKAGTSNEANRGLGVHREIRAIRAAVGADAQNEKLEHLRERLKLPGVQDEVAALRGILPGTSLLNSAFTLRHFDEEARSGTYRIVHIASHGVFGGTAETSFIMAFDDVLTMNGLQSVLNSEKLQAAPIELLSLSACETAEGNDRAPLGIAGAAMKARAKSVLGTLWPVDDIAARTIMERLYQGISKEGISKGQALRAAQLQLLKDPQTSHPFFWAPFVLIGNWM